MWAGYTHFWLALIARICPCHQPCSLYSISCQGCRQKGQRRTPAFLSGLELGRERCGVIPVVPSFTHIKVLVPWHDVWIDNPWLCCFQRPLHLGQMEGKASKSAKNVISSKSWYNMMFERNQNVPYFKPLEGTGLLIQMHPICCLWQPSPISEQSYQQFDVPEWWDRRSREQNLSMIYLSA